MLKERSPKNPSFDGDVVVLAAYKQRNASGYAPPVGTVWGLLMRGVGWGTWWLCCTVIFMSVWMIGWAWAINEFVTGGLVGRGVVVGCLLLGGAAAALIMWHRGVFPGSECSERIRVVGGLVALAEFCTLPFWWTLVGVHRWDGAAEVGSGGDRWWLAVAALFAGLAVWVAFMNRKG